MWSNCKIWLVKFLQPYLYISLVFQFIYLLWTKSWLPYHITHYLLNFSLENGDRNIFVLNYARKFDNVSHRKYIAPFSCVNTLLGFGITSVSLIVWFTHRLEDAGYAVGARVLELLCHREKVWCIVVFLRWSRIWFCSSLFVYWFIYFKPLKRWTTEQSKLALLIFASGCHSHPVYLHNLCWITNLLL